MTANIRCPICRSENVKFSRECHVCEECGREFVPEKAVTLKRVFISYGHDEHATLADRINRDLKARGHQTWFDKDRLKPGNDWAGCIEEGFEWLAADKANSVMVLLLTPYSVRRPKGFCLREIHRAQMRDVDIIPLMVVGCELPIEICDLLWLDMRDCIPISEKEAVYRPSLALLLEAIEEKKIVFDGRQRQLKGHLQPLNFDADLKLHRNHFIGRQWVLEQVETWLKEDPPKQRVFLITGGPGVGKTALSVMLSSRYLEVAALHLCKFGHAQKSDPRWVVRSVVYQLTTQLPEYEAKLAALTNVEPLVQDDARTLFDNLLVQPLSKLNPPKRAVVILIDALDEATRDGRNELASFIAAEFPKKTPEWLRLIITSRPEDAVTAPLLGLNPFILDTENEANRADLRDYLRRELAPLLQGRPDADRIVEHMLARSEGVFLYVERVCDDLLSGNLSLDCPDQFPQGLGGVFWQFFERQFPDQDRFRRDVRPALRAILAAREPLPIEILQRLFGWKNDELRDFCRFLGSLFPVANEGGIDVIKPFHKSLVDWLADEAKAGPYHVSVVEGHAALANVLYEVLLGVAEGSTRKYALAHSPYHLAEARQWSRLLNLVNNPTLDLMRRWVEQGDVADGEACLRGLIEHGNLSKISKAKLATQVARICNMVGQYNDAKYWIDQVLAATSWLSGRRERAVAYHELGSTYLYQGDFNAALGFYRCALRLCLWGLVDRDEAAANYVGLATAYFGLFRLKEMTVLAKQGLHKARQAADIRHELAAERLLATACFFRGEYTEAAGIINVTLPRCNDVLREQVWFLHLKGWLLFEQATRADQAPADAHSCFQAMADTARRIQNTYGFLTATMSLAWCQLVQNQTAKAQEGFEQVIESVRSGAHPGLTADAKVGLAAARHQVGDLRTAGAAYDEEIEFCKEHYLPGLAAKALVGKGAVLWHEGSHDEALKSFKDAEDLAALVSSARVQWIRDCVGRCQRDRSAVPL